MKEFIKYKNNILNILKAFFTYLAFLIYFKIIFSNNTYNFMLTLLFFFLGFFYQTYGNKYRNKNKKMKILVSLFSFVLSAILIVGSIVSSFLGDKGAIIFSYNNIIYSIVGVIGFYLFFQLLVSICLEMIDKIYIIGNRKFTWRMFLKVMFFMFLCWFPYLLRYFPAIMTNDSYYCLHYVVNGILSDYHTFGHTWFVGIFVLLGNYLFHNLNYAVFFYTIIQMLINAFVFTLIVKFLYEKNVKKIIVYVIILWLCFSPLYAIYSITLWRDILFGVSFISLFISLHDYISNDYKLTKSNTIMYLISILVMLFFRNNGIYVFILFVPVFILLSKYNKKIITISNILIIIFYFIIKGPIFDYFSIQKTTSSEAYSIPLQQISRVITQGEDIDKKDYEYLGQVIDVDKVPEEYNPVISDTIKRLVNNEELSKNKINFFRIWIKLFFKHPRTYVEAYFCQTLGYWYPDVIYWATAGDSKSIFDDVDVSSKSLLPKQFKNMDVVTSRKLPLSNLIWSLGIVFIMLLFSLVVLIYKKNYKYILCYVPLICLWITIMIATPVFSELRYVYGLFTCFPLMVICPFIKK